MASVTTCDVATSPLKLPFLEALSPAPCTALPILPEQQQPFDTEQLLQALLEGSAKAAEATDFTERSADQLGSAGPSPPPHLQTFTRRLTSDTETSALTTKSSGDLPPGSDEKFAPIASLYVGHLPGHITELWMYQRFAPFGALMSCKVKTDRATGKCTGVGWVNFVRRQDALDAMNSLQGLHVGDGHYLRITEQLPREVRRYVQMARESRDEITQRDASAPRPHSDNHLQRKLIEALRDTMALRDTAREQDTGATQVQAVPGLDPAPLDPTLLHAATQAPPPAPAVMPGRVTREYVPQVTPQQQQQQAVSTVMDTNAGAAPLVMTVSGPLTPTLPVQFNGQPLYYSSPVPQDSVQPYLAPILEPSAFNAASTGALNPAPSLINAAQALLYAAQIAQISQTAQAAQAAQNSGQPYIYADRHGSLFMLTPQGNLYRMQ